MSIIMHVTLQKIVAHDFRYDPRIWLRNIVSYCKQRMETRTEQQSVTVTLNDTI